MLPVIRPRECVGLHTATTFEWNEVRLRYHFGKLVYFDLICTSSLMAKVAGQHSRSQTEKNVPFWLKSGSRIGKTSYGAGRPRLKSRSELDM